MALGALIIKARLNLTDEKLVEQTKENPFGSLHYFKAAYSDAVPLLQRALAIDEDS
jgi:hypothetical protein